MNDTTTHVITNIHIWKRICSFSMLSNADENALKLLSGFFYVVGGVVFCVTEAKLNRKLNQLSLSLGCQYQNISISTLVIEIVCMLCGNVIAKIFIFKSIR